MMPAERLALDADAVCRCIGVHCECSVSTVIHLQVRPSRCFSSPRRLQGEAPVGPQACRSAQVRCASAYKAGWLVGSLPSAGWLVRLNTVARSVHHCPMRAYHSTTEASVLGAGGTNRRHLYALPSSSSTLPADSPLSVAVFGRQVSMLVHSRALQRSYIRPCVRV